MFPAKSTPCPLVRVQCIHAPAACTEAHSFDVSIQHPNTCVKQETHCRSKGLRESPVHTPTGIYQGLRIKGQLVNNVFLGHII